MIYVSALLDKAIELFKSLLSPLDHDHALARISARPPQKVVLVPADGFWQAVLLSEQIDRPGLPEVLRKDSRLAAFLRRNAVIDLGDSRHHLFPATATHRFEAEDQVATSQSPAAP